MSPQRIRRKRVKGWRMPANTVSVTRPGKWGNPFKVGGYYMMGDFNPDSVHPAFRMTWTRAIPEHADERFTLIKTNQQAVDWFKRLMEVRPWDVSELRGKNLACWCKLGDPCHADILLQLANEP